MIARILSIVSKEYVLQMPDGSRVKSSPMGKVRLQEAPLTGDLVTAEYCSGRWVIQKIMPRTNRLKRPAVANIDQALIVMSVKDPLFSTALIDRLCFLIVNSGVTPVLCVTKTDLGIDAETEKLIREYEEGPMRTIRCAKNELDKDLSFILKDHITVLTGQSGAGKSSLLNQLDPEFHLAVQDISRALGRGKHTTRHNELHEVCGGLVADTPGFSSLDFSHMNEAELAQSVLEFRPYLGKCRFNDCSHQAEPGCAVKKAVEDGKISSERYKNYLVVLKMIQNRKEQYL